MKHIMAAPVGLAGRRETMGCGLKPADWHRHGKSDSCQPLRSTARRSRFEEAAMRPSVVSVGMLLAIGFVVAGCDGPDAIDSSPDIQLAAAVQPAPPLPGPQDFVPQVTNEYFPLIPGKVFRYATEDGEETEVTTVTAETRSIQGIAATVVHDQVFANGVLAEDTKDWYAQDRWGNVWYLGEASCEIVNGGCTSTEGSWETGVAGAEAGIIMWADPAGRRGHTYRQEYLAGTAEDMAKVLRTTLAVTVPAGSYAGCIETMDWTPLEPGAREYKYYCPNVGLVREVSPREHSRNDLVSGA